jgi:hypothetical protein
MKKLFLLLILLCIPGYSQYIPEPVYNSGVYDFLDGIASKGVIKLIDNLKPFSRSFIAERLAEAEKNQTRLTHLEREELKFYLAEYYYESGSRPPAVEFVKSGQSGRWRLFKYNDENFHAYADPIMGIDFRHVNNSYVRHRWNGAKAGGYINGSWGFYLDFRDNEEHGAERDPLKSFTPETGVKYIKETSSSFEWSEVKGGVSYAWSTGSIGIQKEFLNWGSGRGGQIILSSKAPSFPYLRLEVYPAEWIGFTYIHGFLHSAVIDSATVRNTLVASRPSYQEIPKYIASHMVQFNLLDNLNISLGESVVYSERIEPIYLIPVMFFRLADHYMDRKGSNTGDNAQLFADILYRNYFMRTKFYGTLFIDELSVTGILKGVKLGAVAYTLGASAADPLLPNSRLTVEYSRLNPFVYMNSNDVQLYTSHTHQLGHWIGSNADQVFVEYNQGIIRGLRIGISGEIIRRGGKEDPEEQYILPYPDFLYGGSRTFRRLGISASYEFIHDLFIKAEYRNEENNSISLGLWYGR